ncbi:sensor domain-containing diguanylate cyclase [Aureimonas psammosilenae]|uniref:sensor domain-containing diguanylate cyclase n=1 Tax=Aureimonas psammosilenae TaxID=2495496 RepID=UPI0012606BDD|nr:sensor domain-containing diguanylate cyclase [Aureimonas psammosilenae]
MSIGGSRPLSLLEQANGSGNLDLVALAAMHMPCGLAVFDVDDRLVFSNRRFLADLGLPESVPVGIAFPELLAIGVSLGRLTRAEAASIAEHHRTSVSTGPKTEDAEAAGRHLRFSRVSLPGRGWLSTTEDVTERHEAERQIRHMSEHDALTGLGNRSMLRRRFEDGMRRRNVEAVLYVDLDGFKGANDLYGNRIGDELLRAAGARMADCLRDTDFLARFGGDEFVVLLARTGRHDGPESVALRLLRALGKTFAIGDHDIDIGASIGSARCDETGLDLDEAMRRADAALYQAKAYGRGRHIGFDRGSAQMMRFRAAR